jgi:hypothetical protein
MNTTKENRAAAMVITNLWVRFIQTTTKWTGFSEH